MRILVIAEYHANTLNAASLNAIGAAQQLCPNVDVLILGHQLDKALATLAALQGVEQVYFVDHSAYQTVLPELAAVQVAELAKPYSHVLLAASSFGKELLPRIAGLLDLAQISEISGIIDATHFERPIYAGNAIATIESTEARQLISVRSTRFAPAELRTDGQTAKLSELALCAIPDYLPTVIERTSEAHTGPELSNAKVVVAGGRGLDSAENFHAQLGALASVLGAAQGASRAAVDAGFCPNDWQVGQTGKVVAPDLYIALGISGAIQHLAGMKDSKTIIAINRDAEAPIFQVADFGLVGDVNTVVPELVRQLSV